MSRLCGSKLSEVGSVLGIETRWLILLEEAGICMAQHCAVTFDVGKPGREESAEEDGMSVLRIPRFCGSKH